MRFKLWLETFGLFNEGEMVSHYLKQHGIDNQEEVYDVPEVNHFMQKVAAIFPLSLKEGKQGIWLRKDYYLPIKVIFTQETTITLEKQNGKTWEDLCRSRGKETNYHQKRGKCFFTTNSVQIFP